MDTGLNSLIERIKKEGVERAEKDANDIISRAEKKAESIIRDAEKKGADIIEKAESRAHDFKAAAEKALKQTARNVLLALRVRVTEFFDRVIKDKVSEGLSADVLKEVVVKAVENFTRDSGLDIEVLVSEEDRRRLEQALFSALSRKAKERLTLKGTPKIKKGFRIGERDKDSYIDFTDEAIAEAFKRYLNPKLVETLDIGLETDKEMA